MDIQLGYWRWKIYRWNEHPNPFRGRHDLAVEWLRRVSSSSMVMPELRALLERTGLGVATRRDDQQVLEEVAARLSSGEFQVCAESSHPFHTPEFKVVPPDAGAEAEEELAAMTEPPPAPASPPPMEEPEEAPVEQPAPAVSTAAAVADSPAPPPPAPAATTFSDTVNAAATAALMKKAAEEGIPFCEECERIKRKQSAAAAQSVN